MRCPFCSNEESKVTDSRNAEQMNAIKRRRECLSCKKRFTTFEHVDLTIQIKKRDGTYEDFVQEKLIKGLSKACKHTKISHDKVRELVDTITQELVDKQLQQIDSKSLGELVMSHLKDIDMVAYIRFACVYKRFKDIDQLVEVIKKISPATPEEELTEKDEDYAT